MKYVIYALIVLLPAVVMGITFYKGSKDSQKGVSAKKVIARNLVTFALVMAVTCTMAFSVSALDTKADSSDTAAASSQTADTSEDSSSQTDNSKGLGLLAAALVTSVSGIGGGIAVAAGAPAAIAAASENPSSFGRSLIFVALGESIALYGVVISILILNKI